MRCSSKESDVVDYVTVDALGILRVLRAYRAIQIIKRLQAGLDHLRSQREADKGDGLGDKRLP